MPRTTTRTSAKNAKNDKQIKEAARIAAEEALLEAQNEDAELYDINDDEENQIEFGFHGSDESDVFQIGHERAQKLGDSVRFTIKKNSQFLTTKDWPYSWEKLQEEFGAGYYQVFAKRRSNGQMLKQQTEEVAGSPEQESRTKRREYDDDGSPRDPNLSVLAFLQKAEERQQELRREDSRNSESGMATMMQAMMQASTQSMQLLMESQRASSEQFQMMILEMQKQSQAQAQAINMAQKESSQQMLTMLTSIITEKGKDKGEFGLPVMLKMLQDAETRAETRAQKNYELIEKKSEILAEIKAAGLGGGDDDKDESLTKTIIKGFMPVMAQMIQQQPQAQRNVDPQAQAMERFENLRDPRVQAEFDERALRPAIPARDPDASRRGGAPQGQSPSRPVSRPTNVKTETGQSPTGPTLVKNPESEAKTSVQNEPVKPQGTQDLTRPIKEAILNMCMTDVAQGLMNATPAIPVAEEVLKKLENEGYSRQTIAEAFTLEDFQGVVRQYADAIPQDEMARINQWLKEFHEQIQTYSSKTESVATVVEAAKVPKSARTANQSATTKSGNGINADKVSPVARSRSKPASSRTRATTRENSPSK